MSKSSFQALLHDIGHGDIFSNNSNHPQAPVEWQLLVALANLWVYGNAASSHFLSRVFALSGVWCHVGLTIPPLRSFDKAGGVTLSPR